MTEAQTIIARNLKAFNGQALRQAEAIRYYDGDHPLVFSTEKVRKIFPEVTRATFAENWISIVCNAVIDRMGLTGFTVSENEAATDKANGFFDRFSWGALAEEVHQQVVVTGEAFVITDVDEGVPEAYCQPSPNCYAVYDPAHPRKLTAVLKRFLDEDGEKAVWRLYVYERTPDGGCILSKFFAPKDSGTEAKSYTLDTDGEVELPVFPVFHFRADRRQTRPDFADVIPLQDGVNKLFADLMVTSEGCAFPFRAIISAADVENVSALKPGDFISLPGAAGDEQPTSIIQLAQANLNIYTEAKADLAHAIASISRTPRHYFVNSGGDPSGEALQAMEAPLIKKVHRYMARVDGSWRDLCAHMLDLDGMPGIEPEAITVNWDDPRTVQPLSQAQTREINVRAGIPIVTQLRDEGWREAELDQMAEDSMAAGGAGAETLPPLTEQQFTMTEAQLAPIIEAVTTTIGDVAIAKILEGGRLEKLIAAQQAQTAPGAAS